MTSSAPSTSFTNLHLSGPPARPTTRQPRYLAICTTLEPTAPAAADTTTVSPAFGWPISVRPNHAVRPVAPNTLSAQRGSGSDLGSNTRRPLPSLTSESCTPSMPLTHAPTGNFALFDSTTSPIAEARITSPRPTGGQYDFCSVIQMRIAGSIET